MSDLKIVDLFPDELQDDSVAIPKCGRVKFSIIICGWI